MIVSLCDMDHISLTVWKQTQKKKFPFFLFLFENIFNSNKTLEHMPSKHAHDSILSGNVSSSNVFFKSIRINFDSADIHMQEKT